MSARLAYAVYDRPLAQPFRYGNQALTSRRGVLLRKTTGQGELYSEASPLPGHSSDSFIEVLRALATREATELFQASASEHGKLPPSLRFGLEGFVAQESPGPYVVSSNALLAGKNHGEAIERLAQFTDDGYRVCKVKIGPQALGTLLDIIDDSPDFRFRLDANQSLDPAALTKLIEGLERRKLLARVEYLEEPFVGVWEKKSFLGCPLELAADESAPTPAAAAKLFSAANPPSVYIVKPTVAGGLFSLSEHFEAVRAARKKLVFTTTLEAEAGRRSLIAFLTRSPRETAGLSTGDLFFDNFLPDQAAWTSAPLPNEKERAFYDTLAWKECR